MRVCLFSFIVSALFVYDVNAQDIIILDEGFNTEQNLDIPPAQRGEQGCVSIETNRTSGSQGFVSGSLCNPNTSNFEFGPNASETTNDVEYEFFLASGQLDFTQVVRIRKTIGGLERGEHGNWVSNAAYDFDRTLNHRLWQVFGIERINGDDFYVTSARPQQNNQGTPGETIQAALDQIGTFDTNPSFPGSIQRNLGAVVMSLGAGAGNLSDLKCGAGDGQGAVDNLRDRGIAVVVALQNEDLPSNRQSWPACLKDVVLVAGEGASRFTGVRQVGVGANRGIDFFAKDTAPDNSGTQEGNSFAAPRVAAAYAKLHQLFPESSVGQKTEALKDASTLMDSYTTRLLDGSTRTFTARKLRANQMARAISNLTLIQPLPQDDVFDAFGIVDNSEYGAVHGESNESYSVVINFESLAALQNTPDEEGVALKAGTGVLSARRDVEVRFTGVFGGNDGERFILEVNNKILHSFPIIFQTPTELSFIINRNEFNETGDNEIVIRSSLPSNPWGITDVLFDYLPVVPLSIGEVDSNVYGYQQSPSRFTGLRASFELPIIGTDNYVLSAIGFDIDRLDETEVFINDVLLGNLNIGSSSEFSLGVNFLLPKEALQVGTNFIEFVQREPESGVWIGFQDERWAVKDIKVDIVTDTAGDTVNGNNIPTIIPIILLLLEDE